MLPPALRQRAGAHVDELAGAHDVEVRLAKSWRTAQSYARTRQVWVPEIRTGTDYIVALHEIGHIVDTDSRRYGRALTRGPRGHPSTHREIMHEAAAWSWAVQHAELKILRALTKADWYRVGDSWSTYLAC